ncbi:MAG: DUF2244 domain-containing protein [Alphaproteobacteria bacterium]|nr:DUF2244 domain-containing protein [Alphaproteobacteria bacterium]
MRDTLKQTTYLDATLRPHRSLDQRGFLIVMMAIGGCGFLIGFAFFLAGAWPVAGFCGLEIALVYIAFKLNFRDARRCEHLLMTDSGLYIVRTGPSGVIQKERLEPNWLSVQMDDPPQHESQLILKSHGQVTELGRFLQPYERVEVAQAIRAAIARYRTASA